MYKNVYVKEIALPLIPCILYYILNNNNNNNNDNNNKGLEK